MPPDRTPLSEGKSQQPADTSDMRVSRPKLTESDALNRFRITHSDRDLRPLLRRLHRLPHLVRAAASHSGEEPGITSGEDAVEEVQNEKELVWMEVLKWRAGVERVMGSVENLERQRGVYLKRAEETAARTEDLKSTLEQEKVLLAQKLRERDHQIKCDDVAARIIARGRSRRELDEHILALQQEVLNHQTSHTLYLQTVQDRIDAFARIAPIIEEVKAMKLPIEPASTVMFEDEKMEVDEDGAAAAGASLSPTQAKLSAQALPFQPSSAGARSVSGPATIAATAQILPSASAASTDGASGISSQTPTGPAKSMTGHSLPARPARSTPATPPTTPSTVSAARISAPTSTSASARSTLPARPSALRSSTMPGVAIAAGMKTGVSLEEGELGGEEEDGEVAEERGRGGRSLRSRK